MARLQICENSLTNQRPVNAWKSSERGQRLSRTVESHIVFKHHLDLDMISGLFANVEIPNILQADER